MPRIRGAALRELIGVSGKALYDVRMIHGFETIQSPFARLRGLLEGIEPGATPIDMTIGEPRHGMPPFVADVLHMHALDYEKYPPSNGIALLRQAIGRWLQWRYPGLQARIDADAHILPLNGSREGLFSALFVAMTRKHAEQRPAVLMPNPFYQAYYAAALAAGAEPVLLPATAETGHLPDLSAIDGQLMRRTAAFYLASPANPQGAVAEHGYLKTLIEMAREHGFMLFLDECYSEIYPTRPPPGGLEAAQKLGGDFRNVAVFNSLSKRSNVPGLRSGFIAGDAAFLRDYARFRNVACPQVPIPVQHASASLWSDEAHVSQSRSLYAQKFEAAARQLGAMPGFQVPQGGFFLWLDLSHLGGGAAAAKTFWKGYGVKILPGAYLAQSGANGENPGERYARLALVDDLETTITAYTRIADLLSI